MPILTTRLSLPSREHHRCVPVRDDVVARPPTHHRPAGAFCAGHREEQHMNDDGPWDD
jgi:hypothetical protein